jgi:hypothetical protein
VTIQTRWRACPLQPYGHNTALGSAANRWQIRRGALRRRLEGRPSHGVRIGRAPPHDDRLDTTTATVLGECVVIGPRCRLTVSQTVRRNVVVDADSHGRYIVIQTVQPPAPASVP